MYLFIHWLALAVLGLWALYMAYESGRRAGYDAAKQNLTRLAVRVMRKHGYSVLAEHFVQEQYGRDGVPYWFDNG